MNTAIALLTFGGGLAVLLGGALRYFNDIRIANDKAAQEVVRQREQKERDEEAERLAEQRHRETATLIAARAELAQVREQLAAKAPSAAAVKESLASSAVKITELDGAIAQALRDVSKDTAAELQRQAEQLRWFSEGRNSAAVWNKALHPQVERVFKIIDEGAREAAAKGLVRLRSQTVYKRPAAVVYLPYDGPMEGLDANRSMVVQELDFEKFKWVVYFRAGYVEMSPAKEVRPHEVVSPVISIVSNGQELFVLGFGNRAPDDSAPLQIVTSSLPAPASERMKAIQGLYQGGSMSGDRLISEALAEAFKMSIVRADTSR